MAKYKKQKDGRYRAKVTIGDDADDKSIVKYASGNTIKELESNIERIKREHIYGAEKIEREILFSRYVKEWYETYKEPRIAASNAKVYKTIIESIYMPAFGDKRLRSIRPAELQRFLDKHADFKESYMKKIYMIGRQIFRSALSDGIIDHDPTLKIVRPACASGHRRALTAAERLAVLSVIDSEINGLWLALLYYLGVRPGEALGIKWGDIDFKAKSVHIQRDVDYANSQDGVIGSLKNKESDRTIPMPGELARLLRPRRGVPTSYVLQSQTTGEWLRAKESELLWDRLMRRAYDADKTIESRKACNIRNTDEKTQIRRSVVTPYFLRHNYATMLHASGVDVVQASKWLGHKTPVTTLKFYTHLEETKKETESAVIDSVFG